MPQYEARTYRHQLDDRDLVSFTVKIEESDLFIRADKPLQTLALKCLRQQRKLLQEYIRQDPEFATTLKPYSVKDTAPDIVRQMAADASSAGVGPMAAVAGAIAERVGRQLLEHSGEVIVENGGDIFMRVSRVRRVGIFAGQSPYSEKLALEVEPGSDWGICASSGTVGPSLSFGQADAAVAISHSASLADAWATRLGNMVETKSDVEPTIKFARENSPLKGAMLIIGDKLGVYGEVKLVSL